MRGIVTTNELIAASEQPSVLDDLRRRLKLGIVVYNEMPMMNVDYKLGYLNGLTAAVVAIDNLPEPSPTLAGHLQRILADVDEATLAKALKAIKPAPYLNELVDILVVSVEFAPLDPERHAR